MTHLKIEQTEGVMEYTANSIVNKLYELAVSENPVLNNSSNIVGSIHVNGAKQTAVDYLKAKFPNLHITADKYYLDFVDPEVERACVSIWGDGEGVDKQTLAALTDSDMNTDPSPFTNNISKNFVRFPEFASYFPNVHTWGKQNDDFSGIFSRSENLKELDIRNIKTFYIRMGSIDAFSVNSIFPALESWGDGYELENVEYIFRPVCFNLLKVESAVNMPKLKNAYSNIALPHGVFARSYITHVKSLGNITGTLCPHLYNGGTFLNCTKLKSVILPKGITTTYSATFRGCTAMEVLVLQNDLSAVSSEDVSTIELVGTCEVYAPDDLIDSMTVQFTPSHTITPLSTYPDDGYEWIVALRDQYYPKNS